MKLKKYNYIIIMILVLFIGINPIYAISDCELLFDEGLKSFLKDILMYPKIIVPILVILLGTLDFAKAVISSKEDEMKKAQTTFIKRLLLGIVIFFVPTIIDIIMYLANFVWSHFGLDPNCKL
jgi:hypothetical protein